MTKQTKNTQHSTRFEATMTEAPELAADSFAQRTAVGADEKHQAELVTNLMINLIGEGYQRIGKIIEAEETGTMSDGTDADRVALAAVKTQLVALINQLIDWTVNGTTDIYGHHQKTSLLFHEFNEYTGRLRPSAFGIGTDALELFFSRLYRVAGEARRRNAAKIERKALDLLYSEKFGEKMKPRDLLSRTADRSLVDMIRDDKSDLDDAILDAARFTVYNSAGKPVKVSIPKD